MDQSRWAQIDLLFHEALPLAPAARADYLIRAAVDPPLAAEVHRLLGMHDQSGDFLETSDLISPPRTSADLSDLASREGALVDRFRLIRLLGSGGMGEVWLAERADRQFEQRVALKIIRTGRVSSEAVARFMAERQTLARLEHPSITRLIDGGVTEDGRPYFVMEWVDGVPLLDHCRSKQLSLRAKLLLFRSVCDAVQFAHQNLVVHRDLKPANVMVASDGRPRLLDFGIAQLISPNEPDAFPPTNGRALTPEYASPEQLRGGDCGTASDVYSLGVLLHELAAGDGPHRPAGRITLLAGAEIDPIPRLVKLALPRRYSDLDFIVRKALETKPDRRYAAARDLGEDIDRLLGDYPVRARTSTSLYRAKRFIRRNSLLCSALTLMSVGLIASGMVAASSWNRARRERDAAVAATEFLEGVLNSVSPFSLGRDPTVGDLLSRTADRASAELSGRPDVEWRIRMTLAQANVTLWKWDKVRAESVRALSLARKLFGRESAEAARCLTLLGRAQTWLGEPEAVDTQREALALREKLDPADPAAVAESRVALGFALWRTKHESGLQEAEQFYRDGIDLYRRHDSLESHDFARALFSFAGFLQDIKKDGDEIFPILEEAVERFRRSRRPPDKYSTAALLMYSRFQAGMGDIDGALTHLREYVRQVPRDLSDELPLGEAYWFIGLLEHLRGPSEESVAAMRRELEFECRDRARTTGANGWNVAFTSARNIRDVSSLLTALERVVEAMLESPTAKDEELAERLPSHVMLVDRVEDCLAAERFLMNYQAMIDRKHPKQEFGRLAKSGAMGHLKFVQSEAGEAESLLNNAFAAIRMERGVYAPISQLVLRDLIELAERRGATNKSAQLRAHRIVAANPISY